MFCYRVQFFIVNGHVRNSTLQVIELRGFEAVEI